MYRLCVGKRDLWEKEMGWRERRTMTLRSDDEIDECSKKKKKKEIDGFELNGQVVKTCPLYFLSGNFSCQSWPLIFCASQIHIWQTVWSHLLKVSLDFQFYSIATQSDITMGLGTWKYKTMKRKEREIKNRKFENNN